MNKKIAAIFFVSFSYAFVRYHIAGPVPAKEILFILNKALSLSIMFSMLMMLRAKEKPEKKLIFNWITVLISAHIILSLILLRPHYFPAFFDKDEAFTLIGNLALAGGIISAVLMLMGSKIPFSYSFKYVFGIFISLHLIAMGWESWFKPSSWYGYLPPITLLSFLLFLIWFFRKKES